MHRSASWPGGGGGGEVPRKGRSSKPQEQGPPRHSLGPQRVLATWVREVHTTCVMQGDTQPGLSPGLMLAPRGGRCHSQEGGRGPGFVGGRRIEWTSPTGENIQRHSSGRGNTAKAWGAQIHGLLCGHTQLHIPCKPSPGLCSANRDTQHVPHPPYPSWRQAEGH